MSRFELLFILFLVILKFWRFTFWKTQKYYMMSSCMAKLEFLLEPYMLFRLEKLTLIYAACFVLSLVKLCWPFWEVCHAHKIKIMYTLPKKCFTPTLGVNSKKLCSMEYSPNKCSKDLVAISQKFVVEKKHGLYKSYSWKKLKNGQVSKI